MNRRGPGAPGRARLLWLLLLAAALWGLLWSPGSRPAAARMAATGAGAVEMAPQGFGDRDNSAVWSMLWWGESLYAGTNRAWGCWSALAFHRYDPETYPYPPNDPEMACATDPDDLPLQAEIHRWTPRTGEWERLYQSPENVPIPESGKMTARDVGFRTMTLFTEPDGTPALYVGGAYPPAVNPAGRQPPRLLRSVDGQNFAPLPQAPGSGLGEMLQSSFRSLTPFDGRLFVIAASSWGSGPLWEAAEPAAGNDAFRTVSPPGMAVFEMVPYNGRLYVGTDKLSIPFPTGAAPGGSEGYEVFWTDGNGPPPYLFHPVVTGGGHRTPFPSRTVVSMQVFDGRLYVGTDSPAELIRINPDDSWDLIVGTPRETPSGMKYPLSGYDIGFGWPLNVHMWRMAAHADRLYVGTADDTIDLRYTPGYEEYLAAEAGFDLWESEDGVAFYPITTTGFGDPFQWGVRNLVSGPSALYVGSASFWFGHRIYRIDGALHQYLPLMPGEPTVAGTPLLPAGATGLAPAAPPAGVARPRALETDRAAGGGVLLSWEPVDGADRYRIFRAARDDGDVEAAAASAGVSGLHGPFTLVAESRRPWLVDRDVEAGGRSLYYVVALDETGALSPPSNHAAHPPLAPPATLNELERMLAEWGVARPEWHARLRAAQRSGRAAPLIESLAALREELVTTGALPAWRLPDLERQLARMARRAEWVENGWLSPTGWQ